jgi:hypothetical protein
MNKIRFVLPIIFALIFLYFSYSYSAGGPTLNLYVYDGGFYSSNKIKIGANEDEKKNYITDCPNKSEILYCIAPQKAIVKANTEYELKITNLQPNQNFDLEFNCDGISKKETLNPGNSSSYTIFGSFLEPINNTAECYINVKQGTSSGTIYFWIAKEKTNLGPDTYYIYPETTTTMINQPVEFKVFSNKIYCPIPGFKNSLKEGNFKTLKQIVGFINISSDQQPFNTNGSFFRGGNIFHHISKSFSQQGTYKVYIEGSPLSNTAIVNVNAYNLNVSIIPSTIESGKTATCSASVSPLPANYIIYWSQNPASGTFSSPIGNLVNWTAPIVNNTTTITISASTTISGNILTKSIDVTVTPLQYVQKCYMGFGYKCLPGVNPPNPSCQRDPSYDSNCKAQIRE